MSFKILKFNCCGLDVHKTWIYACIGITDSNNRTEYKQARFSSFTKGLNELCDWQVANALIKSKKHPEFITRYKRIKARRGHKKAIIAICRMILTAIWHILTDLKPYTPEGFLESRPVKKEKILTISQALNLLKLRGYVIKDAPLPTS